MDPDSTIFYLDPYTWDIYTYQYFFDTTYTEHV